jgi:plasmid stability protein
MRCYQTVKNDSIGLEFQDARCSMAAVTIRNLRPETHRAIKARAKAKGTSAEAEMRAALDEAFMPTERLKLGSAIRALVLKHGGGFDLQIERDQTPMEPAIFE